MNYIEMEACVIRAKSGNQEDLLKLFEQFKPFIMKTAAKFYIRNHDIYDMLQIGYIAITNAVNKYRTGSHTFACYAFNTIKNSFRYIGRENSKCCNDLSLNIQVDSDGESGIELVDCIKSEVELEEDFISSDRLNQLRKAVSRLPEDEVELVAMVYYNNIPLKTYAQRKGISYYRAKRMRNEILKKLRK